jgi:hypothetical protein
LGSPEAYICKKSDTEGYGALNNKEPSPSSKTVGAIKSAKRCCGNKACEGDGDNVSGVEYGNAGGDLFSGVKEGKYVKSPGVEGSFNGTYIVC